MVVIGGGVIGTSVTYHLAHLGADVLLLERDKLTSGTTWHAAGLMATFGSTSQTSVELRRYTRDLYGRLEAETGLATGLRQVGLIDLATDPGRLAEYRRVAAFSRHLGVEVHEISGREVAGLFPLARTDDVLAGFYSPADGRVNPVDVTMSLARGARMQGARIVEGVPVTGVTSRHGAVTGVRTHRGDVEAQYVVNCAGIWARQLGDQHGVTIPLQAAEHYYLLTEPVDGVTAGLPVLEDPANYGYYREEGGGLLLGLFEPQAAPWHVDEIPADFSFGTLPPDWDRMGPFLARTMSRIPAAEHAGIRMLFCGPESFTPDIAPVVGEAPELAGYFIAAGLNSIGILTGGGIGRLVAHWIMTGRPDADVSAMDPARLHPFQAAPGYRAARTAESLGLVFAAHYPWRQPRTARGARLSPVHHLLAARGAVFCEVSGWEAPRFYAPDAAAWEAAAGEAAAREAAAGRSWGLPDWHEHWAAEHRAAREGVMLADLSSLSKFTVQGADAGRELEWLSAARVDGEPGRVTATPWLNAGGGIEALVSVTKLADNEFRVVTGAGAQRRVLALLRRRLAAAAAAGAVVTDVTSGYAVLSVTGPASRALLAAVTSADVSSEALPGGAARYLDAGRTRMLCLAVSDTGEPGFQLHVPAGQAADAYHALEAAGRDLGLAHAGLAALDSLRLEKGYPACGRDLAVTDTLAEAGLAEAAAPGKPGGFSGADALAAQLAAGPPARRLVQVLLADPGPVLWHAEILRRDGRDAGYISSGSYGWTLGGAVGLAMVSAGGEPVTQDWLESGEWSVQVADQVVPARVSARPLYDAAGERLRG